MDGIPPQPLELWDTLQSCSELTKGSAAGADGNTVDVYRESPFLAILNVHERFKERAKFSLHVASVTVLENLAIYRPSQRQGGSRL